MKLAALNSASFAGLLLAGGRSQRMGRDKAQLDWRGRPLGEHQAATLAATGAWPLFLSCRAEQAWTPANFTRVEDRTPDGGALAAFVDALSATATEWVMVLAIDLPLVEAAWLKRLAEHARQTGVSRVPVRADRFEPFAAVWQRSALPALRGALTKNRSLQEACAELQEKNLLQVMALTADVAACLANLNTPADAARLGCPA